MMDSGEEAKKRRTFIKRAAKVVEAENEEHRGERVRSEQPEAAEAGAVYIHLYTTDALSRVGRPVCWYAGTPLTLADVYGVPGVIPVGLDRIQF